jgi:flagellar biogenesis protein FliO
MLGHYIFNFLFTTLGVIILLYAVYIYIRQNPNLGGLGSHPTLGKGPGLAVETVLNLEPRKRLYVVRYGSQRFLLSTTMDKTELLSTLMAEPESEPEEAGPNGTTDQLPVAPADPVASPLPPGATFMDRFRYSLKTVLVDRFTRQGGK